MDNFTAERFASFTPKKQLTLLFELGKACEEGTGDLAAFRRLSLMLHLPADHPLVPVFARLERYPELATLSDLMVFLVPLERHLGRAVQDKDFLVLDTDRNQTRGGHPVYLVLENIRSAFNVGNMLRIADCLGAAHVYLTGYTPTPENAKVQRSDLGSSEALEWSHCANAEDAINQLRSKHIPLYALETTEKAASIYDIELPRPLAFVVGNERFGVNDQTLARCDTILKIPTWGIKNSLNVANCLAVAGFEALRQWQVRTSPA